MSKLRGRGGKAGEGRGEGGGGGGWNALAERQCALAEAPEEQLLERALAMLVAPSEGPR